MYLAVDVGGTKTFVASITDEGIIEERFRFLTPKNYSIFTEELSKNVAKLSTKQFIAAGISAPGRINHEKGLGVAMGNLPWKNVPIKRDLEKLTNCPVILENDAKLAALSEAILLKDAYNEVLYVTIGTGIGVGIVVNQELVLPDSEGGHMILEYDGHMQKWESFASGRAIVERYGKAASEITDPNAWNNISHTLAVGLIDLIAFAQPEVIVLGGGVSRHFAKFEKPLVSELKKYETPMVPIPDIKIAQRPEEAVLFGCFELARRAYGINPEQNS
jgi:predicted NBD/HSP70 family sugar kinase